jgi:hypothetical protein
MQNPQKVFRLPAADWQRFEEFRAALERASAFGKVSQSEALKIAVSSASIALARGELPLADPGLPVRDLEPKPFPGTPPRDPE